MSYNHHLPTKVEFKPKRKHGMYAVIFFLGWLLPPLGTHRAPPTSLAVSFGGWY